MRHFKHHLDTFPSPTCPSDKVPFIADSNVVIGNGQSTTASLANLPDSYCVLLKGNWFVKAGPAVNVTPSTNARPSPSVAPVPAPTGNVPVSQCPPGHPALVLNHNTLFVDPMEVASVSNQPCITIENSIYMKAPMVADVGPSPKASSAPQLKGEIESLFGSPSGERGENCLITIIMKIENTGAPSIAEGFTMYMQKNGRQFPAQLLRRPVNNVAILWAGEIGYSPSVTLYAEDFLPDKATANQIPNGGKVEGFFQWIVPGLSKPEISGSSVTVHFADMTGKPYLVTIPVLQQYE